MSNFVIYNIFRRIYIQNEKKENYEVDKESFGKVKHMTMQE